MTHCHDETQFNEAAILDLTSVSYLLCVLKDIRPFNLIEFELWRQETNFQKLPKVTGRSVNSICMHFVRLKLDIEADHEMLI